MSERILFPALKQPVRVVWVDWFDDSAASAVDFGMTFTLEEAERFAALVAAAGGALDHFSRQMTTIQSWRGCFRFNAILRRI